MTIDYNKFIQPLAIRTDAEQISLSDWLSQITLCLAPLIVHVFVGVPNAVYLYKKEPRWHDNVGFYNPTTIIWRYMAILDRRVRAKQWKSIDMGATNERFWTEKGWDGSEEMMETSREFCTRIPQASHVKWFSKTSIESVIIIAQGVQAAVEMADGNQGGWNVSIGKVFYPLTLFGLLRLPAALWLSQEGAYTSVHSEETDDFLNSSEYHTLGREPMSDDDLNKEPFPKTTPRSTGLTLHPYHTQPYEAYPRNNWRGRVVRGAYAFCLCVLAGLCLSFAAPYRALSGGTMINISISTFIEVMVYACFALSTLGIFLFHFFRRETSTTVIPCIQSMWYKIYTAILFTSMITLVAVAAIETHKEACGIYTTYASGTEMCKGGVYISPYGQITYNEDVWLEGESFSKVNQSEVIMELYGGLFRGTSTANGTIMKMEAFDGWCKGHSFASIDTRNPQIGIYNSTGWVDRFLGAAPNVSVAINTTENAEGVRIVGTPLWRD